MNVASRGRQILIHGLSFIFVGLVWGLVVPHTPYPRLALGAHIQFEGSGVLFMVVAVLLLKLPHQVGTKSIWVMAFSEVANAWWGTIQMLPIAGHEAGALGGTAWQEGIVKIAHIAAGLALIVAWGLLLVGFVRRVPVPSGD
jgi:(hydroxyamino)benzene mutase